ncbi:MAG: TetR/AcrR family transcriptional regulator [Candidatus Thorarchaeota archaeon]
MNKEQQDVEDLRVQRTKHILRQAIAKLLEDNDLRDISIQQISEQAMIYRTTFYSHYSDKYDLLEDYLIVTWQEEMDIERRRDMDNLKEQYREGILDTVKFFKRYSNLFIQLNENRPLISRRNLIYTTIENTFMLLLDEIQPDDKMTRVSKAKIAEFYTSGYLNVVLNWLSGNTKGSSKSITDDLFTMTFENLYHLLNQSIS